MVTFDKQKEDENGIYYIYFPEDDRKKKPGLIVVDKKNEKIAIAMVAEGDLERDTSPEELNKLINAINKMKQENGETELVEPATESERSVWYGDHAASEIRKYLRKGEIPEKGVQVWY